MLHASVQVIADCTGLIMAVINDFKADLYGLSALSISVAHSFWPTTWPAEIGSFAGFEMQNRKFEASHFRRRLNIL